MLMVLLANGQSFNKEFGFAYAFAAPMATMQQNISRGHGFAMDYYFQVNNRLAIGADLGLVIYGHDKSRQEYTFSDGSVAPMDIIVSNSFFNYMLGTRFIVANGKSVKPYVSFRAGYTAFRTNLSIYDPDDTDHCKPIDRDILLKDGTFSASAGGGIQWDMSAVFNRAPSNTFLFNLGAAITLGGKVNYMNTDAPGHYHTPNSDVNAQFINTQTQVVHEHHVGYVYTSYVELIELRAGFVMRLQR
ncbi:MAG: hypothetical protein L6Q51_08225 [Cyclobacteriaceae bacterium]|nr:hypothetical protein [Cyclobacteriaceae bacterium]